jgi:YedE family putative selenium metabolism protein
VLRSADAPPGRALALVALVGAACGALVLAGNPANMGICGACFLRDIAGTIGLHEKGPAVFRPEIVGVLLGAFLWTSIRGRWQARSGSHAASRLALGFLMGAASLVFLGCPFRLLQRLGGGDGNALSGAAGLLAGVGGALLLERRGYSAGKTSPAPAPVGRWAFAAAMLLLGLFLFDGLPRGPRLDEPGAGPPRAAWGLALLLPTVAGAALSATGFCAISASRQVFSGGGRMLAAAGVLVVAFGATTAAGGKWSPGFSGQFASHGDHLASFVAMAAVGVCGALAGGCPVRQVVMAGEGNGDAAVAVVGIALGASVAHGAGWAATGAGVPPAGRVFAFVALAVAALYGVAAMRSAATPPATS